MRRAKQRRARMALVGDCALSEMQGFLVGRGRDRGLDMDIRYYYFSGLMGTGIAQDAVQEVIAAEKIELVAMSFLTYEGLRDPARGSCHRAGPG